MKVPPLFSRYIAKNFLFAFVGTLLVLAGLILLFDTIDLLRRAASRDHLGFWDVFELGLLKLPQMMPLILPFTVLLAALITFYRLSKSNELVIARSAGLSVWNFLTPIFIAVFVIGLFNLMVFNPFAATMRQRYETEENIKFQKQVANISWTSKGLWLREKKDGLPVVIHADSVKQEGRTLVLVDTTVLELSNQEGLVRQIEAPRATLKDNVITVPSGLSFNEMGVKEEVRDIRIPSEMDLDKIVQTFDSSESFSFWQLPSFIKLLDDSGFSSVRHRVYYFSLMASTVYLLAMMFIAAVFSLSPNQRSGRTLFKMCLAVLCGFVLFFASQITNALGLSGALPAVLATFGPSVVAIFLACSALLHLEDG